MAGPLPDGEPVPASGELPRRAFAEMAAKPLSIYIHVPFCATRCGYCDFNTYTSGELGSMSTDAYVEAALAEIRLARRVLGPTAPPVTTVFFGGGTPSLLPAGDLAKLLGEVRAQFGLAKDAEVTTEANPESVDRVKLDDWLAAGLNRLSLGMQSAVPHVLATLDRVHTPGRALQVADWAHQAGFDEVSLDLIYGTPGESLADWATSLEVALTACPSHVSAYSLILEPGTRLARRVARGELPVPDEDELADKYLLAERQLTASGLVNYETSNWSKGPAHRARHNMAYWLGHHWWGVGPGAHSHIGGVRWWNVKHPRGYAERLAAGRSPAQAREILDDESRRVERVLLELRLAEGLPLNVLTDSERRRAVRVVGDGLATLVNDRLTLTLRGRLLADAVVRDLLD